jgi:CRISPR system Cascade subunit CasC
MKIELHLLQNVAPACLNRDDTNTPKDCEFGGVRRARISSQCLKRAVRSDPTFSETLHSELGIRTKGLVSQLTKRLTTQGKTEEEAVAVATGFVEATLSAVEEKNTKTKVLLYLGEDEMQRMAAILLEQYDTLLAASNAAKSAPTDAKKSATAGAKKNKTDPFKDACAQAAKTFKGGTKAADIALFGRMMAENPETNIDAACQVAHAISTNKVAMEMDFYTAVDDLQGDAETGAGMMGFTGFNSSCFYRYAVIDLVQLEKNLGGDRELAHKAVEAFIRASVTALPTGKQNSMAAHNPPDAIFAVVRKGGTPVSLANAFTKPVRPERDTDLMEASITRLDDYWGKLTTVYGETSIAAKAICTIPTVELKHLHAAKTNSLAEVVTTVMQALNGGPA